jgi:hypothetical protein
MVNSVAAEIVIEILGHSLTSNSQIHRHGPLVYKGPRLLKSGAYFACVDIGEQFLIRVRVVAGASLSLLRWNLLD